MRILVVGAGATGGYFGGRLAQAGRDVTFLVRSARAAQIRADGLRIVSPQHGDAVLRPPAVTADALKSAYDVVILTVKAYALPEAIADLAPAVGPQTMILPVLNGMRHVDLLIARFGEKPVLGGVCMVATTLDDQNRIVQLADFQQLVYGERDGAASDRIAALDQAMKGAGFTARASTAILREMWEKWVYLATLGGITCLMRGTIGEIEAAGGASLAAALLDECLAVSAASGFPLGDDYRRQRGAMLTAPGSGAASSMYRDLQRGNPVEAEHIVGDMLARARVLGVPAPILDTALAHLRVYQNRLATA